MTKITNAKLLDTVENLKPKQKEIIDNILRFRYLTRPQLQLLLNHKTWKRVITWLNELTDKQYIFQFYTKKTCCKTRTGINKPA